MLGQGKSKITRILSFCFVFILSDIIADSVFPKIELKDIDLTKYKCIKAGVEKGAARAVYVSIEGDHFVKIWDAHFWRCPYFLQGLKIGFYDEKNTPLIAIIYDKGRCRGYVTRAGTTLCRSELTDGGTFLPIKNQKSPAYIGFYHDLLKRIKSLGYVYIDLTPSNIVLENHKIKIIDLEPLLPISKVERSFFFNRSYPPDYRSYIRKLK